MVLAECWKFLGIPGRRRVREAQMPGRYAPCTIRLGDVINGDLRITATIIHQIEPGGIRFGGEKIADTILVASEPKLTKRQSGVGGNLSITPVTCPEHVQKNVQSGYHRPGLKHHQSGGTINIAAAELMSCRLSVAQFDFTVVVRSHTGENFLAENRNMVGSRDSQADAVTTNFQNLDVDVAANDDFFVRFSA
jgi:hypothetical protein